MSRDEERRQLTPQLMEDDDDARIEAASRIGLPFWEEAADVILVWVTQSCLLQL